MSKSIVIMQPSFLPWAGYFNLMYQADNFVFLDDVQLEKQSWQTRNRLLIGGKAHWISVPIKHMKISQTIKETLLHNNKQLVTKLEKTITQNYGKHLYYNSAREVLDVLFENLSLCLSELCECIIQFISSKLGIISNVHLSSAIPVSGARTERLVALCEYFEADEYLSPVGSEEYLKLDGFTQKTNILLRFHDYAPQPYPQKGTKKFIPNLSILDVIANLGWKGARQYVQSGKYYD
jgi:hypothetical protein